MITTAELQQAEAELSLREPLRLYHFASAQNGLKVLRERRLHVSRISKLNDPFELICVELRKRTQRDLVRQLRDELDKEFGLICFSRQWTNPVQWAHYASKHTGLCLGFDVKGATQVRYVASRPNWPSALDGEFITQLLFTKFSHWSYEDEYRFFTSLRTEEEGHYYVNFSDLVNLREVIVGARCELTRSDISHALGDLYPNVSSFKAREAFQSFQICENEKKSMWK